MNTLQLPSRAGARLRQWAAALSAVMGMGAASPALAQTDGHTHAPAVPSAQPGAAQQDHHAHHAPADAPQARLHLNHGKRWPTDAPLRAGMSALQRAFAAQAPASRAGRISQADYAALGRQVESEVAQIVAQCQLTPEADAMLHLVIADMLEGAALMTAPSPERAPEGARQVRRALDQYGRYFDHPGWAKPPRR